MLTDRPTDRPTDHNDINTPKNQSPELTPLLRLAWNKLDPNYLATFMADSAKTLIIGARPFYCV